MKDILKLLSDDVIKQCEESELFKNLDKLITNKTALIESKKLMYLYFQTVLNRDVEKSRETLQPILEETKRVKEKNDYIKVYNKILEIFPKYYHNRVDFNNLKIKVIPCETEEEKNIWTFFRNYFSNLPNNGTLGKNQRYLIIDENTNFLLGTIQLTSPPLALGPRDEWLHSEKKLAYEYRESIPNLSICVPTYPFSMLTGGKLMSAIALSKEVVKDYEKKLNGDPLINVFTTSLYGKSIQYDRLKELKLIGMTKGNSSIPYTIVNVGPIWNYFKKIHKWEEPTASVGMTRLQKIGKELGIPDLMKTEMVKGIYMGNLCEKNVFDDPNFNIKTFKRINEETAEEKYQFWKERWMKRRFEKYPQEYLIKEIENTKNKIIKRINELNGVSSIDDYF